MFIADMVRKATGASYPAVNDRIVMESLIPLPLLAEQRWIAAILDQAEVLRAKRRHALAQLDTLNQSLFHDLFGDPIENPQRFRVKQLIEIVDQSRPISYGILMPGPDQETGVPYVQQRLDNLRRKSSAQRNGNSRVSVRLCNDSASNIEPFTQPAGLG